MPGKCLIVAAAPSEARAVLAPFGVDDSFASQPWCLHALDARFDLVVSGIGKANAAGAAARHLEAAKHACVLSMGVAGALPDSGLAPGQVVLASASVFADEGLQTDEQFSDCAAMGFPLADFPGSAVPADPRLFSGLRPLADVAGAIATVSTCSGTDPLGRMVRDRTGAVAEAMEGAAVALVAHRLRIPMAEVRVVSNTTGSRPRQVWDLRGALARLSDLAAAVRDRPVHL